MRTFPEELGIIFPIWDPFVPVQAFGNSYSISYTGYGRLCTMKREKLSAGGRMPGIWVSAALLLCCTLLFTAGCTGPQQAGVKTNDTVRVFYTLSFPDGTEFQSNVNGTPLEFTVGSGKVIAGFDKAVIGMTPGMTKTVTISKEEAYGPYRQELVNALETEQVLGKIKQLEADGNYREIEYPEIGTVVLWQMPDGQIGYLRFTNITAETTTVDENHPLAGMDLVFKITLVEIVGNTS